MMRNLPYFIFYCVCLFLGAAGMTVALFGHDLPGSTLMSVNSGFTIGFALAGIHNLRS